MRLFTFCKILLALALVYIPTGAHAEIIESFDVEMFVHADSTFTVTEHITYTFDTERHGIERTIPLVLLHESTAWFKERYQDIEVHEVLLDTYAVPHEVNDTGDAVAFRIGDPEKTLTGTHTYSITYTVSGGITYDRFGGADLYWNATGHEWGVPMRSVSVRVAGDDGVLVRGRSCYQGAIGASGSCDPVTEEGSTVIFRARELMPYEGVTVAQAVNRTNLPLVEFERVHKEMFIIPLVIILIIGASYAAYQYKTQHRTHRTIIPQYEPYKGLKPMYTGLLMDGRLDARDITACIVYLAAEGYLKIRKTEKKILGIFNTDDYEITIRKEIDDNVSSFERRVLTVLFGAEMVVGTSVSLAVLKKDTRRQNENAMHIRGLQQDLRKDLVHAGFYEEIALSHFLRLSAGAVLFGIVLAFLAPQSITPIAFSVIVLVIIILMVVHARRTKKGYEVLDHLKGFKEFLTVTEKDRYWFHNAPEKNPEQFMAFLPYAIAFGVEEKWAAAFEGITMPNPDWYDGGSVAAFSPTSLSTSLGVFSSALASSSVSTSSASSGGGFSGGGGGGGGGGSW